MDCVLGQAWRASCSNLPMKRFARVGATGVPMATPFVCLIVLAANSKVFSWRTCSSISLSMFLRGFVLAVGGLVGMVCWRSKVTPIFWGIDEYRALTSSVARKRKSLFFIGIESASMAWMTCVNEVMR